MSGRRHAVRGASMIEVLVTLVIIAFGLLGMVGLQARLQVSELESYQRSQALLLASDMANRIAANRNNAAAYVTGTTNHLGSAMTCPTATATMRDVDVKEWCEALQGAAEVSAGASKVGAMIGGRGCIESIGGDYLITVVWQGMTPISAPPASLACGRNAFNGGAGSCVDDLCRRAVSTVVRIGTL